MKSKFSTCIFAMTLLAALAVPAGLAAQKPKQQSRTTPHFKLTVLPTLGGTFGSAAFLNSRGSVTGFSSLAGDMQADAFIWQKGVMTDLGILGGGPVSNGVAVNDRDAVSGFLNTSTPNEEDFCGFGNLLICLPFVWQKGVMTALPLLGGNNGQASGINNRGQIVGISETPNSDTCSPFLQQAEAVIWQDGNVQELPPFPGDKDGSANWINDAGQAVGLSGCVATNTIRAVLWPKGPNGGVIDLGNLGGTGFNIAFGINERTQVVGQANLPGDTTHHAFLWEDGVMTDLGTLYGLPVSLGSGINNRGQVVGFSQDLNSQNTVAFFWQDGAMTDLNTLIPPGSPLFLQEAAGINDRGQISGYGLLSDGEVRGFLLTPCGDHHPGLEGCDYSMVEAKAVPPAAPARHEASGPTPPAAAAWRRGNRLHLPTFGTRN